MCCGLWKWNQRVVDFIISLFIIAYKSPQSDEKLKWINLLSFIEEYYLQEKP